MSGGLIGIHSMLGGLVVVALIVVVVVAAVQAGSGDGRLTRTVSIAASVILLLQYLIGFLLLGGGSRNSMTHYILAILILIPIGLQHSSARRLSARSQGVAMIIWALAAAFLSIITYMTGLQGTPAAA
jgi:hypothetical protein